MPIHSRTRHRKCESGQNQKNKLGLKCLLGSTGVGSVGVRWGQCVCVCVRACGGLGVVDGGKLRVGGGGW